MTDALVKSSEHLNRQFVDRRDTVNTIRMDTETIKAVPTTVVVWQGTISGILIVNHSTYGKVHEYPIYYPLILGHSTMGILGTNYLWSSSVYNKSEVRVVNNNNTFVERFVHTDFVDSSSTTASVVVGSGVSFSNGDVFVSEVFAMNNTTYSTYTVTMEGVDTSNLSTSVINGGLSGLKVSFSASGSATLSKYYVVYS